MRFIYAIPLIVLLCVVGVLAYDFLGIGYSTYAGNGSIKSFKYHDSFQAYHEDYLYSNVTDRVVLAGHQSYYDEITVETVNISLEVEKSNLYNHCISQNERYRFITKEINGLTVYEYYSTYGEFYMLFEKNGKVFRITFDHDDPRNEEDNRHYQEMRLIANSIH